MPDLDSAVFRQLCGRFATGVAVVTATDAGGTPVGMTANSFTSVSLDPPLVSVNIDHQAEMRTRLLEVPRFAVNILESSQEALSRRFATDHPDRFRGVAHHRTELGLPALDGALAVLECERFAEYDAGDHTIFVGRVVAGTTGKGKPLIYYRGGYHDGMLE
jgi:flavin reductase (DIM6/NTAB) family NADH-FMN oxidoreductase RutF